MFGCRKAMCAFIVEFISKVCGKLCVLLCFPRFVASLRGESMPVTAFRCVQSTSQQRASNWLANDQHLTLLSAATTKKSQKLSVPQAFAKKVPFGMCYTTLYV